MKRVAYICADPGVPVFGSKGCSIHVQEVVRAMARRGLTVELFATRFDGEPPLDLREIVVHRLPQCPRGDVAEREKHCQLANNILREALDAAGPFDLVYERYSLWSNAAIHWAADHSVPSVLEVNAPLIDEQAKHRGLVDRVAAERNAMSIFASAGAIVAVSDALLGWFDRFAVPREKVHVVPNGVDPARFPLHLAPAIASDPSTCTIGFVGTLKPWHGLDFLFDVFAELYRGDQSWRLLMVGDGPLREQLEADALHRGFAQAVTFTGAVAFEQVPAMLRSMDIAVAPYPRWQAGEFYFSPMKIYEYMAASLPIVASRIGQIEHVIRNGISGVMAPPGEAGAWIEALCALRNDPRRRLELGRAARCAAIADHSWNRVAARILTIAQPLTKVMA